MNTIVHEVGGGGSLTHRVVKAEEGLDEYVTLIHTVIHTVIQTTLIHTT